MRILSFLALLFLIIGLASTTTINCRYHNNNFEDFGTIYLCSVEDPVDITSSDLASIEVINGNHEDGKNNDDVQGFFVVSKTVQYFPRNLEKFFKNIKLIIIQNTLKEIHQSDLKPFSQLGYLNLGYNNIQVLEEGLFDYNPLLERITLSGNKISHIYPNVFDSLTNLKSLSLGDNVCISSSSNDVKEAIEIVKANCPRPE